VDNGSFSVDPAAHDSARSGDKPYPGATARAVDLTKPDPAKEKTGDPYADLDPAKKAEAQAPTDDKPNADPAEAKPAEGDGEAEAEASKDAKADDATDATFDPAPFYAEFGETGDLSEESRATVKDALPGVTDDMISTYLQGMKAGQSQVESAGFALVGGQDNYAAMAEWTAQNVPNAERVAFNKMLNAGEAEAKLAIQGMYKRYSDAVGPTEREPDLSTNGQRAAGNAPIRSRADLRAKMRDPRYAKDANFRADVDRQLSASLKSPDYRTW